MSAPMLDHSDPWNYADQVVGIDGARDPGADLANLEAFESFDPKPNHEQEFDLAELAMMAGVRARPPRVLCVHVLPAGCRLTHPRSMLRIRWTLSECRLQNRCARLRCSYHHAGVPSSRAVPTQAAARRALAVPKRKTMSSSRTISVRAARI